ncbi:hypothetical protein FBZ98_1011011 [Rhizobium sp. ERR 922]|nr:hypothetical protein FBZ98_1011011 [Rhizobium sp. ERR 922]TWC04592.1 hypothetical protein FBZ97_1011011 [Rhizobium sp. ERR 942]
MHRTDIDDDGTDILAGTSIPSSGPPLGPTVIPFPRDRSAAGLANEGTEAASVPSPFESLGSATQAVVMRLANKRLRIKVLVAEAGREGSTRDES